MSKNSLKIQSLIVNVESLNEKVRSLTNKIEKILNPPEPPKEKELTLFFTDGNRKEIVKGYDFNYYSEYNRIYIKNEDNETIAMFSGVTGFTSKNV